MLYIAPTPIGNLEDITIRTLRILQQVDLIAAEDTRRTGLLLRHFAIHTSMISLHVHNEQQRTNQLIQQLQQGLSIALVSNAGTPIINDPGYHLVKCCRQANIRVVPLPGPCAAITALSAAGIASYRFCYEGFLPANRNSRKSFLQGVAHESRTIIFYASPHSLLDILADIAAIFGAKRYVILARELTKIWESIHGLPVGELIDWVQVEKNRSRGEIVLVVEGYRKNRNEEDVSPDVIKILALLKQYLPLKTATAITAEIYGVKNKVLYKHAIDQKDNNAIKSM